MEVQRTKNLSVGKQMKYETDILEDFLKLKKLDTRNIDIMNVADVVGSLQNFNKVENLIQVQRASIYYAINIIKYLRGSGKGSASLVTEKRDLGKYLKEKLDENLGLFKNEIHDQRTQTYGQLG